MNDASRRRALAAYRDGTASLDQYAMIFEDALEADRLQILASVPALVAHENAGGRLTPDSAVAYPPDVPLPDSVVTRISDLFSSATMPMSVAPLAEGPRGAIAWLRAPAAIRALVLGADGLELRQRAWRAGPDGYVTSDEVTDLSATSGLTVADADLFLGLGDLVSTAVAGGVIRSTGTDLDRRVGRAQVTYDQIANLVRDLEVHGALPRPVPCMSGGR